jgi:hypothetical protein
MTPNGSWTPRLPEPLPAVLAGAGFFFFLAALSPLGSFAALDQWLWRNLSNVSSPPPPALTAVRVLGSPQPLSAGAKADALAADVTWLRAQGAGAIVLEAWLDETPQADARAFADALRARFEALPPGAARARSLELLSETAASLDAPQRLARALGAAQPLVLAFQALPGGGASLPPALRRLVYTVSLRGELKTLPPYQPLHLPYEQALAAVELVGAVPPASPEPDRVAAAVCVDGCWVNGLGLEAARLALGLPLDGLHYRWRKGVLSSVELMDVRYPVDGEGRLLLSLPGPQVPDLDMDRLRRDPVQANGIRGKLVFFRPWPTRLGEAQSFEDQARLFAAVVERDVLLPPARAAMKLSWCLLWALAILVMAYGPSWAGLLAWCFLPGMAFWDFSQQPQALAQPLTLALSALLLGMGWALQRRRGLRAAAEARLGGRVAPRHQAGWLLRLGGGGASLPAAYAMAGPRARLQGPQWEAWMDRWGALVDDHSAADGLGLVLVHAQARADMVRALLELRAQFNGCHSALACGTLSFRLDRTLGALVWKIQGPPKDRALDLFKDVSPGEIWMTNKDFSDFKDLVESKKQGNSVRVLGPAATL